MQSMVDKSKYVEKTYKIDKSVENILNTIITISKDNNKYYVFPLSDYSALFCDEYFDKVPHNVIMPNAMGDMRRLENKYVMANLAEQIGLKTPKHIEINLQNTEELNWNIFPTIIKPLLSIDGLKSDITIVYNLSELKKSLKKFVEKGYNRVLLEQYITGKEEYMIEILGYVDKSNNIFFSNIIHKVREFPIKNGSTSYAYFTDEEKDIDKTMLAKFVKKCNFWGIFDFEFKYSDGKSYFIEMNFRNGAPSYASTISGLNIPYCWMLNKNSKNLKKKNFSFMIEQNDIINLLRGEVKLKDWIYEFLTAKKIFWKWKDFSPCLSYYNNLILQIIRRRKWKKQIGK